MKALNAFWPFFVLTLVLAGCSSGSTDNDVTESDVLTDANIPIDVVADSTGDTTDRTDIQDVPQDRE